MLPIQPEHRLDAPPVPERPDPVCKPLEEAPLAPNGVGLVHARLHIEAHPHLSRGIGKLTGAPEESDPLGHARGPLLDHPAGLLGRLAADVHATDFYAPVDPAIAHRVIRHEKQDNERADEGEHED